LLTACSVSLRRGAVSAWVVCLWGRKGQGVVLRLARGREEGLLAGVADDAHGSLVLWGDVRLDHGAPRCQRFSLGRAVPSSTATRPWCRPSCRSGRASAPPWLPVKAVSRSRSDGILRPARFGISVAGDSGTSTAGDRGHTLPPPILMYESFLPWFLVSLVFSLALANAMRRDTSGRSLATVFFFSARG
jgi:hypothetical protein